MNRVLIILLGALATVALSLFGVVLIPKWQISDLTPVEIEGPGGERITYPQPLRDYDEAPGRRVYIAQGCIYCHSQQIRPENFAGDVDRGWGTRRSVPRDYLLDAPPLLGTMRTGPDLANIGVRQPADQWHHLHLYDARLVSPGSIMPPMPFLYDVVFEDPKARGYALPEGRYNKPAWIVPKPEARQLVAYLQALHQDHSLKEVQ
jgi:cytochrome c oxidase cbb3-type subunit 2